jgi:PAS domain S-box-containing protein
MPHNPEIRKFKLPGLDMAVISLVYLTVFLVLTVVSSHTTTSLGAHVWYGPAGLNFALLLLWGWRVAPLVFIADFLGKFWILAPQVPVGVLILGSVELAAVQGAAMAWLKRLTGVETRTWGLREYTLLVAFLMGTTLVNTGLGLFALLLFRLVSWQQCQYLLYDWWMGAVLGGLNLMPLFLTLAGMVWIPNQKSPNFSLLRGVNLIRLGQVVSIPLTLWFCFRSPLAGHYELLYLCFLPLLWIALRDSLTGAVLATLAINLGAIQLVSHYDTESMPSLQLMMLILSLTGIFLGAVNGQRRSAERNLRANEQLLRQAMDNSPAGFVIYDSDLRIQFVNSFFLRIFGCRKQDILGHRDEELFPPETTAVYLPALQAAFVRREIQTLEGKFRTSAGTFFMEFCFVPLVDQHGKVRRLLSIVYDIGKLKEAEAVLQRDKDMLARLVTNRTEDLIQAQVALEKSRRLSDIGVLAASVAHELRNPLGVIKLAAYNLKQKHPDDRQTLNIEKKVAESERIINNLLSYARIKTPQFEKINLEEILRECAENVLAKNPGRGAALDLALQALHGKTFEADPFQLREIVTNILDNAFQAIPEPGGRIAIRARTGKPGFIDILFEDNGAGIAPEDLPRIFDPFFTRKSRGTGLGLTISHELIQLQHGFLSVESQSGQGTTVQVSLPDPR